MSSHEWIPDFQKQSAATTAATIDRYEIVSGEMPARTQNRVAASAVHRKIRAMGRREVGSYSAIQSGFRANSAFVDGIHP
jgi:hypothetical protein